MKIVAVTACPVGVAHTYLAKNALIKKAKLFNDDIWVETQGSIGIEDELTLQQINEADLVILALGCDIEKKERFEGKKTYKCEIGDMITSADAIFKIIHE